MRATEFRILGPLEAVADGQLLRLGGPKQRALLASLLLRRNEVVPRERLVDTVWGDDPPESAYNSVQVYVHGLRRALGEERIERRGTGYRLHVGDGELDLARFEARVERARRALDAGRPADAAAELEAALALWSGSPLADLAAEPVAGEAATLEELRLQALELRIDAGLALGRHSELVPEVAALVAEEPYRERFREQQVLALYRAGRQKEALEAYRAAREALVEELGVEPGPALQALERAVLQQDAALAAPTRRALGLALPAPPTALVGRQLEIAAVASLLREDARLVTLTGPGGTGKTRLALAVAAELAPELPDGAAFVDLSSLTDPALLVATVASALGVPEERPLVEELHDRSLLLVLDNLEQLLDGVTAIGSLLAGASGVRVLATSRVPLRLYGEHEYAVPPLTPPVAGSPFEAAASNDAVRLFAARARAADPSFGLSEAQLRDVASICRRLDGLPLALELAAARVNLLSPQEILDELDASLDVLAGGARDLHPRQRTLRATLDWSFDALSPEEQRVFARLAVFAGGFSADAATRVTEGDPLALVEHSLVRWSHGRLSLLETIRAYARERLNEDAADEERARDRHLDAFVELAEGANARIVAAEGAEEAYDALDLEHDNLRAALDWSAASGRIEAELRLAVALRQFWIVRGHVAEGRRRFDRAISSAGAAPLPLRAAALTHGAAFAYRQADLATARAWWEEALELHRRADAPEEVARCLGELGSVALSEGDLERAEELYAESAAVFERVGNPLREAVVVANLGVIASLRGDLPAAVAYGERAAAIQRQAGDLDGLSITLHNLARNLASLDRTAEARPALRESLELARRLDYREVIANGLEGAAELVHAAGDDERAARLLGASVAAFEALGLTISGEEREGYDRTLAALRNDLGEDAADELHAVGRAASFETSLDDALESLGAG